MKCIECKWYVGTANDVYGLCKRYPTAQNKTQQDWCGEYASKVVVISPPQEELIPTISIQFEEPTDKPKRGRKPKNDN